MNLLGWLLLSVGLLVLAYLLWARYRLVQRPVGLGGLPLNVTKVGVWEIRYHKSGRGPALLLLHGLGADLYCWRWIAPLLAKHFTVIMPDLPGFGRSSKIAGGAYGLDEQAERLQEFCHRLGSDSFYVVGNSMGGNIALWMAIRFPAQVLGCGVIAPAASRGLVPLSVRPWMWLSGPLSYTVNRSSLKWAHRRTLSRHDRLDDARVEETFQTYGGNTEAIRSFLAAVDCIRDPRLAQRLKEIKARVLILWGSKDKLVSRKVIDGLESALEAHESHVHLGGGHHLQEDEPEWCSEKIQTFFGRSLD